MRRRRFGQGGAGLLTGTVKDVNGGVLPGVTVTLTSVATNSRVEEVAQEVPIPVSVIRGDLVADAGAFNVNRLKEMLPTVQFYSTNPRNSAINIRGLGAPFGLTNDGIEPGVGLYIDGVFYRPSGRGDARLPRRRAGRGAARTAGHAVRQEHDRRRHQRDDAQAELHAGHRRRAQLRQPRLRPGQGIDHRPVAARRSPAACRSPARSATASCSTPRTGDDVNDLNNLGLRGQVLFAPSDQLAIDAGARPHAPAAEGLHAGGGRRRADAARGQPAVRADRRRSQLHAAQLQRVRPPDRRRHADALLPGPRRHLGERRLEGRPRPADVDDRVALSGTGSRRTTATSSACRSRRSRRRRRTRGSGRRKCATRAMLLQARELRGRRCSASSRRSTRTRHSSRSRDRRRRGSCWRRAPTPRRRGCSTATASTST